MLLARSLNQGGRAFFCSPKAKNLLRKNFLFFVEAAIRRKLSDSDLTIFIAINLPVQYKNSQNIYYKYVMPNYKNR